MAEPPSSFEADMYGMYPVAFGDSGAASDGEGSSDNTSGDEERDESHEESVEELTNVAEATSSRARERNLVRPQGHFIDLARINAVHQNTHRGERDRSRGDSGTRSGQRHRRQRDRRRHPPRRRNGRGEGGH